MVNPDFHRTFRPLSRQEGHESRLTPDVVPEREVTNKSKAVQTIESPRSRDLPTPLVEPLLGKNRGIEGDWNSSAMDTTIFTMFAYTDAFDELLKMKMTDRLGELQTFLRDYIVRELREGEGFVERTFHSPPVSLSMNHFSMIQAT